MEGTLEAGEWTHGAGDALGISVPRKQELAVMVAKECFVGTFGNRYADGEYYRFPADGETFKGTISDGKFRLEGGLIRVSSDELDTNSSMVVKCDKPKIGGGAFNAANTGGARRFKD